MKWNDVMAKDAQKWADHLTSLGRLVHAKEKKGEIKKGLGENLYSSSYMGCQKITCADALHSW